MYILETKYEDEWIPIEFRGNLYKTEVTDTGERIWVNTGLMMFDLVQHSVQPRAFILHRKEMGFHFDPLATGRYRIIKNFSREDNYQRVESFYLAAEFTIYEEIRYNEFTENFFRRLF
jgi:hypothetical protein